MERPAVAPAQSSLQHANSFARAPLEGSQRGTPLPRPAYREGVDRATPQPDELGLALARTAHTTTSGTADSLPPPPLDKLLLDDLCLLAQTASVGLLPADFEPILLAIGAKHNFGLPTGTMPSPDRKEAFLRTLHLEELALAQACALGRETAWLQFLTRFRQPLNQAAISITRSSSLGHDLAESLYAELFGLSERAGRRTSPLSSYSGRGSLLGWLRTTLAHRHIDHHRRTRRETPLDDLDAPAPAAALAPLPTELTHLSQAVSRTLATLSPDDRFLLASYFLDRQTLLQISRLLHVHEATVSRKLKRLTADLRKQLLRNLHSSGLSKRAAEEALGADPRDLEINLRKLLQTSQTLAFSDQTTRAHPATSHQPAANPPPPTT